MKQVKTESEYVNSVKQYLAGNDAVKAVCQIVELPLPSQPAIFTQIIRKVTPDLDWEADHTYDYLSDEKLEEELHRIAEHAVGELRNLIADYDQGIQYRKEYQLAVTYGWLKDGDYQHLRRCEPLVAQDDEEAIGRLANLEPTVPKRISESGKEWGREVVKIESRLVSDAGKVVQNWTTLRTD